MTPDQHRQGFLAFVAGLIGDVDCHLDRLDVDPPRDSASYRLAGMWLTETELIEFARELVAVVQPRLANAPKPGRKRHILATVMVPGPD